MAITATERFEIEKLLVLMFNAAPGADYLAQVVGLYEATGHNLQTVANALDDIPAFQSLHPNFQTAAEFAADFLTPLGLQNDDVAKNFVMDKFNAGVPKGEIMYEGLQALNSIGAGASAQYVTAKAILENKATVSEYYSVTKGISQTDIALLQTVLNGVTADAATVTTAEHNIDNGTVGSPGVTLSLSPAQDTLVGTNAADIINGLFGGADATYTAGDSIDGKLGTDSLNLVATGTATPAAVIVKNVETINIQDTVGATYNALLVENAPAINFTNTVAAQLSTVTNAELGSTIGLAGAGNLAVGYRAGATSGSTDTARLSLNNASAAAINVSNANTIEAVSIATTGKNVVTLDPGTAAGTITVTGDGTNTFTFANIKATSTIDASASTGTNTFKLGTTLSNGDVVKGGTGADTIEFKAISALGIVTLTGVETLKAEFDVDALLNLGTSTGIKTVTLAGSLDNATITNAPADLTTLNISSFGTGVTGKDVTLDYAKGVTGALAVNIGTATGTGTTHVDMDTLSVAGAGSFTLNALGTATTPHNIEYVTLDDTTASITLNGASTGGLEVYDISAGEGLKFLTQTVAADGYVSAGYIYAGDATDVAISQNVNASGTGYLNWVSAGSFADITSTLGAHASGYLYAEAGAGGAGNVSLTVGSGGDGYVEVQADNDAGSAADIGNVTLTVASGGWAGGPASGWNGYSSYSYISGGLLAYTSSGDVGNVVVNVGSNAHGAAYVSALGYGDDDGLYAGGGNVGDVTLNVTGNNASGYVSAYASAGYSGADGAGGNIGNIAINVEGDSAYASGYFVASGGNVGNIDVSVGENAAASFGVTAFDFYSGSYSAGSGGGFGNVGTVNVSVGVSGYASFGVHGDGGVGATTITLEDNANASFGLSARGGDVGDISITGASGASFNGYAYTSGGDVGNLTATLGDDGYAWYQATAGGSIGDTSLTVGENGTAYAYLNAPDGDIGAVTETVGAGSNASVYAHADGEVGQVKIAGGDDSVGASVDVMGHLVGGVDLSGWLGYYSINVSAEAGGAVILAGAAGGTIYATEGADVITGGAGNDAIYAGGGADVVTGGAGNDTINGGAGADDMTGGAGDDTYYVDNVGDLIHEGAGGGTDSVYTSVANWTNGSVGFANIENIYYNVAGTTGNDTITGGAGADTIDGGAGNDSLSGAAGNDSLTGGADNDTLDGGTGNDTMVGGTGNDVYYVDSANDVVVENAGEGTDTVHSTAASYTLASEVENLILDGTSAINGTGNASANTITGNSAANTINGAAGADTIEGGAGVDTMTGGTEADTFVFSASDLVTPVAYASAAVTDVITDFVSATDKVDFAAVGTATNYAEGSTAFADLASLLAAANTAIDGSTVQYYFGWTTAGNGYLVHGQDTTADAVVQLTGLNSAAGFDYTDIV